MGIKAMADGRVTAESPRMEQRPPSPSPDESGEAEMPVKQLPIVASDGDDSVDSDFDDREPRRKTVAAVAIRKRKTPGDAAPIEDPTAICSICIRPWHSSGEHRICCLKCGHLFGRNCIRKWIQLKGNCPECQQRARPCDVVVLFTSRLSVKDTSQSDELSARIEQEQADRRRAEADLAHLRKKYTRLNERFIQLRSTLSVASIDAPFVAVDSVATKGSRVLLFVAGSNSLLMSASGSERGSFGYRRTSLLDCHHSRFVSLHTAEVRDLHANEPDQLVLSASLDRHLRISSLQTETCVADIDVEQAIWSCTWADPFTLMAGTANGVVVSYDIRKLGAPLGRAQLRSRLPIHALRRVDPLSGRSTIRMLCAGPGHAAIVSTDTTLTSLKYESMPIDGSRCVGAAADPKSQAIVVTTRLPERAMAAHTLMAWDETDVGLTEICTTVEAPHSIGMALGRPSLFTHDGQAWIGSGDYASRSAWLWLSSRASDYVTLGRQPNGVLDMAYASSLPLLATLSDSKLILYKACTK